MNIQNTLEKRSLELAKTGGILDHARVYLSGPMDFVASREEEKANGWRTRISQFLLGMGTTIFDPWNKPEVIGMPHYGKEDEFTAEKRKNWTYEGYASRKTRDTLCQEFWPTLHIDLRMTDLADFVIAYCPTNVYSVGTVHEVAVARQERKPVLLVTPRIDLDSSMNELRAHLESQNDTKGLALLKASEEVTPRISNKGAIPSLWYMAMIGNEDYFFDGFGFDAYREKMGWAESALDVHERLNPPARPLLPYLEKLNDQIPRRFSADHNGEVENPEWLIFANSDVTQRAAR